MLLTLTTITVVYAKDQHDTKFVTYTKDITGDDKPDKISISGIHKGKKYKNLEINIVTSKDKKYGIPLSGNQKPTVSFKDLNYDGTKDLFVSSTDFKGKNAIENHLYSFKNDQFTNIGLPESLSLTAQLENNYLASIVIDQTGNEYRIDVKNKKQSLDRTGLYQNGRLNEPTELIVHSFSQINPVRLRDMKFGLKGSQTIGDSYTGATIANVFSIWKWSNGRWELQKTVVKKSRNKKI